MRGKGIPIRILLSLFVMLGAGGVTVGGTLAGDASEVYVTQLAGAEVRVESPWAIDPALGTFDPAVDTEVIGISTWKSGVIIGYLPGFASPVQARDFFMSMFEAEMDATVQVDRGDYGSVSYSLDILEVEGERLGVFTLFMTDRPSGYLEMTCLFALPELFAEELASARMSITVDGGPVFDGVDGAGLQDLLVAALPDGGGVLAPAATPDSATLADMHELGFVEEGLYISPQFGTEVTWGPEWILDSFIGEPLESSAYPKQDSVLLDWTDGMLAFAGVVITEGDQDSWESWLSGGLEEGDTLDVLHTVTEGDTTVAVLRLRSPEGVEMYAITEVRCADATCEFTVGVLMMGLRETLADAYVDALASISVDGVPAFSLLTPEELEAIIDMSPSTPQDPIPAG